MNIKKGLLLLIATTLVGSNCFADNLYDSGVYVVPVNNIQKPSQSAELAKLIPKFELDTNNIELSLAIAEILYSDGQIDNAMEQIGFSIGQIKNNKEQLNEFTDFIYKKMKTTNNSVFYNLVLAKVYKLQGNYALAADQYKKILETSPNDTKTQIELAKTYQELGNHVSTITIIDNILKKYPLTQSVRSYRAKSYLALGKKEKAEAEFRNSLYLDPDDENSAIGIYLCTKDKKKVSEILSEVYPKYKTKQIKSEDYKKFAQIVRSVEKNEIPNKEIYKELLTMEPKNPDIYTKLSYIYETEHDYNSLKNLLSISHMFFQEKSLDTKLFISKENDPSMDIIAAMGKISPDPITDANELLLTKRTEEAIHLLTNVKNPNFKTYNLLGEIYSTIEDQTNSAIAYEKAYETEPESHETLYIIAKSYKNAGNLDKSQEYIEKAIELSPDNQNYITFEKEIVTKKIELPLEIMRKAMEDDDTILATDTINQIFENKYIPAEAYVARGLMRQKVGNNEEALKDFLKAYELAPNNTSTLRCLADIYEDSDKNQAIKYYELCTRATNDPNNEDAKYAKNKLKEIKKITPVNLLKK